MFSQHLFIWTHEASYKIRLQLGKSGTVQGSNKASGVRATKAHYV